MTWRKIFNKDYDTKITISLRGVLKQIFRKPDFDNIMYRMTIDHDNNRVILTFKHGKE